MKDIAEIRAGEELNKESLEAYLHERLDKLFSLMTVKQFPAGSSNLTYSIELDGEEFVLRRPPFGNRVKSAHDMSREFEVLSKLSKVYEPAPKPLLYCSDESVIGSEFYLMERRYGMIVRGYWPVEIVYDSEDVTHSFIANLARLHSIDYEAAGLAGLGRPVGYTKRQVEGWSRRYFNSKTDEWPEVEKAIEWLNGRIPDDDSAALVHNDYKFDNIILDPIDTKRIVAVLDWEMATIGSPLMDLGTTLGYWMSADAGREMMDMPFNPKVLMSAISRAELVEMYASVSGRDVSNIYYYYVFGTIKIAVIAQQIYYRFAKGYTQDQRFSQFNKFVGALGRIAAGAIRNGSV